MAHVVVLEDFEIIADLISKDEIVDLITMFYKWGDSQFEVTCSDEDPHRRGAHVYAHMSQVHKISISRVAIERGVQGRARMGGNKTAPSVRMGLAMVLVHEIQHANQTGLHNYAENFYTHPHYMTRPCEREARDFVDKNMAVINSIMSQDGFHDEITLAEGTGVYGMKAPTFDRVEDIADVFEANSRVSMADLLTELKLSGLNSPKNAGRLRAICQQKGIEIF